MSASGPSESISIDVDLDPDALRDLALPLARADAHGAAAAQVPLDWALRRMRAQALLSGLASGAVVAVAILAWQSFAARGPPPAAPAAAVAGETPPAADRGAPARPPAQRRSVASRTRAAEHRAPARPEPAESGWIPVEDSGDGEVGTPGVEAGDGDGTLADTGDDTRAGARSDGGGAGAVSADGDGGTRPSDEGGQAHVPPGEAGDGAEPAATAALGTAPGAEPLAAGQAPDASEVAAALRGRRAELEACLAEANAASVGAPQRSSSLRLLVVVDPSGRVSNALLNDEPGDSTAFGACLLRIAQAMSFTPFEGDPARVRLALSRVAR